MALAACAATLGLTGCESSEPGGDAPAQVVAPGRLDIETRPSAAARSEIPPERLRAYRAAGDELAIDWAVVAAVSGLETRHGRSGPGPAAREDALAIGYALKSSGAPADYRAALAARGGGAFARRALALADVYAGDVDAAAEPPAESGELDDPVEGEVVAGFGTLYGRPHLGLDFDARTATLVRAAASGVVSDVGTVPAYGRYICLLHAYPDALLGRKSLTTCYGYLGSINRSAGEVVARGDSLGSSGCTGACLSPRVHFIVRDGPRPDSQPIDPAPFLDAGGDGDDS